jgi:hypothetical protein
MPERAPSVGDFSKSNGPLFFMRGGDRHRMCLPCSRGSCPRSWTTAGAPTPVPTGPSSDLRAQDFMLNDELNVRMTQRLTS